MRDDRYLIPVAEALSLARGHLARRTLYHWLSIGRLTSTHVRGLTLVDWDEVSQLIDLRRETNRLPRLDRTA